MSDFLRITYWPTPAETVTMVIPEEDLEDGCLETVEGATDAGFFTTFEVFEAPSFEEAMFLAAGRVEHNEHNQAVAYHYYAQMLGNPQIHNKTVIAGTVPQPLSRELVAWVFRNVAKHPNYKGQRIIAPIEEGAALVEMVNGEVLPA